MPKKKVGVGRYGGVCWFLILFFSISTGQKRRRIITPFQPKSDKEKQRFKSLETAPRNLRLLKLNIVGLTAWIVFDTGGILFFFYCYTMCLRRLLWKKKTVKKPRLSITTYFLELETCKKKKERFAAVTSVIERNTMLPKLSETNCLSAANGARLMNRLLGTKSKLPHLVVNVGCKSLFCESQCAAS